MKDYSNRKIFIISDCHFFHTNVIKYCNRPFTVVKQMNEQLLKNWNSTVPEDALVFHCGDFVVGAGNEKDSVARTLYENLSGDVWFLKGNHDTWNLIPEKLIKHSVYYFTYKKLKIAISHYPPMGSNADRMIDVDKDTDLIIYGHVHQNTRYEVKNAFNVSVENINYTPISLDEIIERILKV
jgi:calcineurin-like phosphoesterase family protein